MPQRGRPGRARLPALRGAVRGRARGGAAAAALQREADHPHWPPGQCLRDARLRALYRPEPPLPREVPRGAQPQRHRHLRASLGGRFRTCGSEDAVAGPGAGQCGNGDHAGLRCDGIPGGGRHLLSGCVPDSGLRPVPRLRRVQVHGAQTPQRLRQARCPVAGRRQQACGTSAAPLGPRETVVLVRVLLLRLLRLPRRPHAPSFRGQRVAGCG
mmetsp:Transcript_9765/g.27419  ORF Transcript_9765/g.27419 Transcript_9765/m.27419 type:complete len:213 (-) Transcript_9765:1058-1696(-)